MRVFIFFPLHKVWFYYCIMMYIYCKYCCICAVFTINPYQVYNFTFITLPETLADVRLCARCFPLFWSQGFTLYSYCQISLNCHLVLFKFGNVMILRIMENLVDFIAFLQREPIWVNSCSLSYQKRGSSLKGKNFASEEQTSSFERRPDIYKGGKYNFERVASLELCLFFWK